MPRRTLITVRRDTGAAWLAANPTPAAGEPILDTDTGRLRIGDGTTPYAYLDPLPERVPPTSAHIVPSTSTTVTSQRTGSALTTGTMSGAALTADGFLINFATSGGGGAAAGVASYNMFRRGTNGDLSAGVLARSRIRLPDASYNNSGASTGSRLAGLMLSNNATPATILGADAWTGEHIGFTRHHVNGGATDANWMIDTANGTTNTRASTGVPFVAGHVYRFRLYLPYAGTTVWWSLTDATAAVSAQGSTSQTLPAAGTTLNANIGVLSINGVVRNFQLDRLYADAERG